MLIGLNVVLFFVQISLGNEAERFIYQWGLIPARYTVGEIAYHFSFGAQVFSLFSFMFLHGGFLHLLGNVWFLYIFGDNVEDHLGHGRYLFFYLFCGWASGIVHILFNWHSTIPTIGASGAVAGVMGAYILLHPRAKILTLVPVIIFPLFFEIPAFVFLGIWFVFQFLSAAGGQSHAAGVAFWAHVGGFVAGMALLPFLRASPKAKIEDRFQKATAKAGSPRFQVVRPTGLPESPDLFATLVLTPEEAVRGVQKTINSAWGFHNRIFKVNIPPGSKDGTLVRLHGAGRRIDETSAGDLYLRIAIRLPAKAGMW
jgi:membrane associated rhomboid family serine protease